MYSFNSSNNLYYNILTKILLFLFLDFEVNDLKCDDRVVPLTIIEIVFALLGFSSKN